MRRSHDDRFPSIATAEPKLYPPRRAHWVTVSVAASSSCRCERTRTQNQCLAPPSSSYGAPTTMGRHYWPRVKGVALKRYRCPGGPHATARWRRGRATPDRAICRGLRCRTTVVQPLCPPGWAAVVCGLGSGRRQRRTTPVFGPSGVSAVSTRLKFMLPWPALEPVRTECRQGESPATGASGLGFRFAPSK